MTIDEFIRAIEDTAPPAPADKLAQLENELGTSLPEDYREFLVACNGGFVGGALWYEGPTPSGGTADAGVHHIGGLREEPHFSLTNNRDGYGRRIPYELFWIMDDPFGNAICLGLRGAHRGRIYFRDHELEPDPKHWDGQIATAGNISLIALSFTEFVAGLKPVSEE